MAGPRTPLLTGTGNAQAQIYPDFTGGVPPFSGLPILNNNVLVGNAQKLDFNGMTVVIDGIDPTQVDVSPGPVAQFTQLGTPIKVVTFGATPNFDPADGGYQKLTLTGNCQWSITNGGGAFPAIASLQAQQMQLVFIQDATGGRTIGNTPANVLLINGPYVPSAGANATSNLILRWDNGANLWVEVARNVQPFSDLRPHVKLAGNINTAGVPSGVIAVDGVNSNTGDFVLVLANSFNPVQAGLFIANNAGPWMRPPWFASGAFAAGAMVFVTQGMSNNQEFYKCDNVTGGDLIDTNTLTFSPVVIGGLQIAPNTILYGNGLGSGWVGNLTPWVQVLGTQLITMRYDGVNNTEAFFSNNGTTNLGFGGSSGFNFNSITARRHGSHQINVTPSATPTFDSARGNYHPITMAVSITSWTVPNGNADSTGSLGGTEMQCEEIEIAFLQTNNALTLSAPPANVVINPFVLTGTAGTMDRLKLKWDSTQLKWYESGRTMGLTY